MSGWQGLRAQAHRGGQHAGVRLLKPLPSTHLAVSPHHMVLPPPALWVLAGGGRPSWLAQFKERNPRLLPALPLGPLSRSESQLASGKGCQGDSTSGSTILEKVPKETWTGLLGSFGGAHYLRILSAVPGLGTGPRAGRVVCQPGEAQALWLQGGAPGLRPHSLLVLLLAPAPAAGRLGPTLRACACSLCVGGCPLSCWPVTRPHSAYSSIFAGSQPAA